MSTTQTAELPDLTHASNGNGNGKHDSPGTTAAKQAWDTARAKAVKTALSPLETCEAIRLRAANDKDLSHPAVRVLVMLLCLMWKKEAGGFYKGQMGVIAITSRRLARMARVNQKALWSHKQVKKKVGPDGKPLRVQKADNEQGEAVWNFVWEETGRVFSGILDQLVAGGYVWIAKHRIPNIQELRWLNVYHVCEFSPRLVQGDLDGWESANWDPESVIDATDDGAGESTDVSGGCRDFSASKEQRSAQTPPNQADHSIKEERAAPSTNVGPHPPLTSGRTLQERRPAPSKNVGPTPPETSVRYLQDLRAAVTGGCGPTLPEVLKGETQDQRRVVPSNSPTYTGTRLTTRASGAEEEKRFLELCLAVFGDREMNGPLPRRPKGNGGLWRRIYQEYPAKAWACVREAKECKATRPATLKKGSNWAAFTMDLFKMDRLNFGKRPKAAA